jgi:hypothetical protein
MVAMNLRLNEDDSGPVPETGSGEPPPCLAVLVAFAEPEGG